MSTSSAPSLRTVAFGDLDAGVWGAAFGTAHTAATLGVVGNAQSSFPAANIDGSSESGEWQLSAEGVQLTLSPVGDPVRVIPTAGVPGGFDQLCRVHGRSVLGGSERTIDCLGRRGWRQEGPDLRRFESLRDVSAWFEPDEGVALVSLRPRNARGHGEDLISAAVFEPTGSVVIADPRLSTTFTADAVPSRVSLELWPDEQIDDTEADAEPEHQPYPRRVAGEAVDDTSLSAGPELEVRTVLLRCHSRGREGTGVYVLVRAR